MLGPHSPTSPDTRGLGCLPCYTLTADVVDHASENRLSKCPLSGILGSPCLSSCLAAWSQLLQQLIPRKFRELCLRVSAVVITTFLIHTSFCGWVSKAKLSVGRSYTFLLNPSPLPMFMFTRFWESFSFWQAEFKCQVHRETQSQVELINFSYV